MSNPIIRINMKGLEKTCGVSFEDVIGVLDKSQIPYTVPKDIKTRGSPRFFKYGIINVHVQHRDLCLDSFPKSCFSGQRRIQAGQRFHLKAAYKTGKGFNKNQLDGVFSFLDGQLLEDTEIIFYEDN